MAQFVILLISFAVSAQAEDARSGRVREELERQLHEMVKLPAASVEIVFDGIDSTRYKLLDASFSLDEATLPFKAGKGVLYTGDVEPGKHTLTARLTYEESSGAGVISYASGLKFKVPGKFIFNAQRGIFMRVHARVEVDDGAEPAKRLQLVGNAEMDLRSKLEDGVLPPLERPKPETEERRAVGSRKKSALANVGSSEQGGTTQRKQRHRSDKPSTQFAVASDARPDLIRPAAARPKDHRASSTQSGAEATSAEITGGSAAAESSGTSVAESARASRAGETRSDAGAIARADEEVDAGRATAPALTVTAPPPVPLQPPPPPIAAEGIGATTIMIGVAAAAVIAVLAFVFSRRQR